MPTNRLRLKFSKIALICNKTCMFLYIPPIPNQTTTPQRSSGKTNPVKRSFQDSWFTNRTSLHYDEANDLTFCMVAYKDGKLRTFTKHLSSMDFRSRRMLVLPSRNTIPQSAIGIGKNEQSDYLTCRLYKERTDALDLRGKKRCSIFSSKDALASL